jgi:WXG100 family type VII secretion target
VSNLMTDSAMMRDFQRKFAEHATTIEAESGRAYASSTNISGAGWYGSAEGASMTSMGDMQKAFNNIRDMMQFTSDNLGRSADQYDEGEHNATATLSS